MTKYLVYATRHEHIEGYPLYKGGVKVAREASEHSLEVLHYFTSGVERQTREQALRDALALREGVKLIDIKEIKA